MNINNFRGLDQDKIYHFFHKYTGSSWYGKVVDVKPLFNSFKYIEVKFIDGTSKEKGEVICDVDIIGEFKELPQ